MPERSWIQASGMSGLDDAGAVSWCGILQLGRDMVFPAEGVAGRTQKVTKMGDIS